MKPKVQRPTSSNGKNVNSANSRGEPPNSATHSRRPKNCWLIPALEAGKGRVSHQPPSRHIVCRLRQKLPYSHPSPSIIVSRQSYDLNTDWCDKSPFTNLVP